MIVYKLEDRYDQKTGEKTGTHQEYDHVICDFTGKKGQYTNDLGNTYTVDYNSCDPCFGCVDFEFDFSNEHHFDIYELLGLEYTFDEMSYNKGESKTPIIQEMFKTYKKETGEQVEFLDHLFRWARVRTVRRLVEEGKYTLEQFGIEIFEPEEDED